MDLVIRGGSVVDGTGAAPVAADVGIVGSRIVEVGNIASKGRREIDAEGLLVTPGFVDIHTHYDGQATWDPLLAPSSWHGVTSVVMGNCGVGFAPARPDHHDFLISLLEGVEDIPGAALAEGLAWDWESFPEYLDALARLPRAIDVAGYVPHAALRAYVMGERGADANEAPTADELVRMTQLVGEALEAGAMGFATSRTEAHRTSKGQNIGTLRADATELLAITGALSDADSGAIQLISDAYRTTDDDYAQSELDLIEAIATATGRPLSFTVQQADEAPERWRDLKSRIDHMAARGLRVRGQVAQRPVGLLMGLEATLSPFTPCRSVAALAHLPLGERVAALRDPETKRRVLQEHADIVSGVGSANAFYRRIAESFDTIFQLSDPVQYFVTAAEAIGAQASARGHDPAGAVYDAMLERDGHALLYRPIFNYSHRNFDDMAEMVQRPNTLFGLSDAGAHCGAICDASSPTSTLTMWSRDRTDGPRLPVEQMIHGYTQRNAEFVGWHDRGVVASGYLADVNLIDLAALGCAHPEIIHDLPAGGRRLVQRASGFRCTIKRGEVTFDNGVATGALPGVVVRGKQPKP
ncbi:MAG: N-acyl-D-aspartate/D-glutamate deacylase [Acidimicrobiia bacterium]|nr:N-acyl-D-aspartate/D-glutamate deacylase [Acidimicrobiia bacterium]